MKRQEDVLEAIKGGFLHLDFLGEPDVFGGKDTSPKHDDIKVKRIIAYRPGSDVQLQFLPPGKGTCTIHLKYRPKPAFGSLFDATLVVSDHIPLDSIEEAEDIAIGKTYRWRGPL